MCKKVATARTTPQLMRMYAYKWCYLNYLQALPLFTWAPFESLPAQYAGS